jgi:hypothetical protein
MNALPLLVTASPFGRSSTTSVSVPNGAKRARKSDSVVWGESIDTYNLGSIIATHIHTIVTHRVGESSLMSACTIVDVRRMRSSSLPPSGLGPAYLTINSFCVCGSTILSCSSIMARSALVASAKTMNHSLQHHRSHAEQQTSVERTRTRMTLRNARVCRTL